MTRLPNENPRPPTAPPALDPPATRGLRPSIATIGAILLLLGIFTFPIGPYDPRTPLWQSPLHCAASVVALLSLLLVASAAISDARAERHARQRGFEILPPTKDPNP
ncbi:MAG TPA: hypothetical protein VEA69_06995 [Tepidisphaeraceae bacterium]|nr:hypothetical protein [Tepidisphaeraceae bacterium]